MPQDFLLALEEKKIIVGDGAFGTMLQAKGLPAGMMPELWNAENPDAVRAVHQAYLEAGSQIMTANTFGGNPYRLASAGLEGRLEELNRKAIEIAKEVAGDAAWVAASIGPTGELMQPFGTLSPEDAELAYGRQVEVVAAAGADLILLETHHDLEEAACAARAALQHTELPVLATFAFNARGRTMMGLRPEDAARRMQELGVVAVGANCGEGPQAVHAALEKMAEATTLPLIAQANAGVPQVNAERTVWVVGADEMAAHVLDFVHLGARIVGGCCGTTPAHIAAIVHRLRVEGLI